MRLKIMLMTIILGWTASGISQSSVVEDLIAQIQLLKEGDELTMTYYFVGCYGPYQKGSINITILQDTLEFTSTSFDSNSNKHITQTATRLKDPFLESMQESGQVKSSEILGNTIHYQFMNQDQSLGKGYAYIDQRHFIELFHPFSSFSKQPALFKWNTKGIIQQH